MIRSSMRYSIMQSVAVQKIKISVIIPTLNRAPYLRTALESVLNQTLDRKFYEIIVVDNGSVDHTKKVVQDLNRLYENAIRYFYEPEPGLHVGRHLGVKKSRGHILSFIDDDIIAFHEWLGNVLKSFESRSDAALVGGKILPAYEIDPPAWYDSLWDTNDFGKIEGWLALVDLGKKVKEIPPDYVYGCNFSIRKTVLEKCEGFHPDYMPWKLKKYIGNGETYVSEFIQRNNLGTIYNPEASVYHRIPAKRLTRSYFGKRAYLQAISYSYSITRKSDNKYKLLISVAKRIKAIILYELLLSKKNLRIHWLCYIYGLVWHQICILKEPKLLDWIKKDNYIG